jgi:hypothetical protein
MCQKARRDRRWCLTLVGGAATNRQSIKDSLVEIDKRMPILSVRRRGRDGAGAVPSVQADENEPGKMPKWSFICGD